MRRWGAIETACCAAGFLLVGAAPLGCTVYENLSLSGWDASGEPNVAEPSSDGPIRPETDRADARPNEGGVASRDSAIDASVDATEDPSEDASDGQADSVGAADTDAGTDASEEDHSDGEADGVGPPQADVVDAGSDAGDDAGASVDVSFDVSSDVADSHDADAGGVRDVVDTVTPPTGLIDDMEDNDSFILPLDGRQGVWFTVNDGTPGATQTPGTPFTMSAIPAGRGASLYAARSSGSGFASWRPLIGFWFHQPPTGPKQPYDVSRYRGVTFFARLVASDAATVATSVRMVMPDRDTDPDGMICTGGGCNDHFGMNIVLSPEWTSYTILFGTMTQEGWGTQVGQFDAENAYGIEFEFPLQATFDCWIDDIAFVP